MAHQQLFSKNNATMMDLLKRNVFAGLGLIVLFVLALSSCTQSELYSPKNENSYLRLTLKSNTSINSGSMPENEREIFIDKDLLSVLVFRHENDGRELLHSKAIVKNLTYTTSNKNYEVTLAVQGEHDMATSLVFLVNNGSFNNINSFIGKTKEEIFSELSFSTIDGQKKYKWDPSNTSDYAIPMWGESKVFKFSKTLGRLDKPISLMRSVARFDFGFSYSVNSSGNENFLDPNKNPYKLASIQAYNILDKALLAPSSLDSESEVLTPSVPVGADNIKLVDFKLDEITNKPVKQLVYLLENKGGVYDTDRFRVTTFVLGIHNDSFNNPANPSEPKVRYFRVDLTKSGVTNILDILRNNRYIVSIEDIKGEGYNTPDEAYKRESDIYVNVTVKPWKTETSDRLIGSTEYQRVLLSKRQVSLNYSGNPVGIQMFTNVDRRKIKYEMNNGSIGDFYDVEVVKSTDQPSDYPDKLKNSDILDPSALIGLVKYDIILTPKLDHITNPEFKKDSFTLTVGNSEYPIDVRLYTNIFRVVVTKSTVNGKYIKDYNIENGKYKGKDEYVDLVIEYENYLKSEQTLSFNIRGDKKGGDVVLKGNTTLSLPAQGKGKRTIRMKASGTPKEVGNMIFKLSVDNEKIGFEEDTKDLVIVFTYRAMRIIVGDNDRKFLDNGIFPYMLNNNIIGTKENSIIKCQPPVIIEYRRGSEHKYDRWVNDGYDLVFLSSLSTQRNYTIPKYLLDVYDGKSKDPRYVHQKIFILDTFHYIRGESGSYNVIASMLIKTRSGAFHPYSYSGGSFETFNPTVVVDKNDLLGNRTSDGYPLSQTTKVLLGSGNNVFMLKDLRYGYFWSGVRDIFYEHPQLIFEPGSNTPMTKRAEIVADIFEFAIKYAHDNNFYYYDYGRRQSTLIDMYEPPVPVHDND